VTASSESVSPPRANVRLPPPSSPRIPPGPPSTGAHPGESPPVQIRDLSATTASSRLRLAEVNSTPDEPQSHALYNELVKHARMRLQGSKAGHVTVSVAEDGAVHVLAVPSPEFFRFVHRFRTARRLPNIHEAALSDLSHLIEARAVDQPLQLGVTPDREGEAPVDRAVRQPSPTGENASAPDLMAYALNRLVLSSPYVFVPSVLADALGESERRVTSTFVENRDRLRELGFDSRSVSSSLGPVFLVTRVLRRRLDLRLASR